MSGCEPRPVKQLAPSREELAHALLSRIGLHVLELLLEQVGPEQTAVHEQQAPSTRGACGNAGFGAWSGATTSCRGSPPDTSRGVGRTPACTARCPPRRRFCRDRSRRRSHADRRTSPAIHARRRHDLGRNAASASREQAMRSSEPIGAPRSCRCPRPGRIRWRSSLEDVLSGAWPGDLGRDPYQVSFVVTLAALCPVQGRAPSRS